MEADKTAKRVVDTMYEKDAFSRWLGIERITIAPGHCVLQMKVREEMVNGFDIIHGGITFSLADSALAFAANSHGRLSVALDASISFPAAVRKGDVLTAEAKEFSLTHRTGIYDIAVSNQRGERVALFKGTVYRKEQEWFPVKK